MTGASPVARSGRGSEEGQEDRQGRGRHGGTEGTEARIVRPVRGASWSGGISGRCNTGDGRGRPSGTGSELSRNAPA